MAYFYTNYMDKYKKSKEYIDAVILSPKQVLSFKKFLEVTEAGIKQEQVDVPDYHKQWQNDLNIIQGLKDKVENIISIGNSPFTLVEGLLLVSLMMTFKHRHYDTDAISEDLEYIAEQVDTLYHEKGYVQLFHIFKEDKLS